MESILKSDNEKILIAIADNYGNLDKYNDRTADAIRQYMTKEKRQEHMSLLDLSRAYYDAYVSRPYMIYKDKDKNASEIFNLYKKLFCDRNILIIEGENTKTGIIIAVTMFGCFLSGMMGITMKYIVDSNLPLLSRINPANMITDGLYALYYYNTPERYILNIVSLAVFSALMIILSAAGLRRQKYDSI